MTAAKFNALKNGVGDAAYCAAQPMLSPSPMASSSVDRDCVRALDTSHAADGMARRGVSPPQ